MEENRTVYHTPPEVLEFIDYWRSVVERFPDTFSPGEYHRQAQRQMFSCVHVEPEKAAVPGPTPCSLCGSARATHRATITTSIGVSAAVYCPPCLSKVRVQFVDNPINAGGEFSVREIG